ncbi:MAG: aminodeoxychorismate synthase component I, partial [Armatimonadetes bacterium]|nr:aminodeoxychorismate synthase component I [Armatimonadota bacterium]
DIFSRLAHIPGSVLLESQPSPGIPGARYSVICTKPFGTLTTIGDRTVLELLSTTRIYDSPFVALRDVLGAFTIAYSNEVVFPGGLVGYLGYELLRFVENVQISRVDDVGMPDCWLGIYPGAIIFDHLDRTVVLTHCSFDNTGNSADELAYLEELVWSAKSEERTDTRQSLRIRTGALTSSFSRGEYCEAVRKVKEYIAAGDVYQVNLSQRFVVSLDADAWEVYLALRASNPAPYAAYLNIGGATILSSSPESFLVYNPRERIVVTRPIKGTRPRGVDDVEDGRLVLELQASDKDRAENLMIVDLERNDLGRVCQFGSVHVPELMVVESYPNVHHLVSTITGVLRDDCDVTDLLLACFPGGSITGAPKIRAMQIIDELEPVRRGVYTGSIGWMGFDQSVNLNIAIRTAVIKDSACYFSVGGGIVADSEPEVEYQETLDKGKAFFEVLRCGQDSD